MRHHGVGEFTGVVVPEADVAILVGRDGEGKRRVGHDPRDGTNFQGAAAAAAAAATGGVLEGREKKEKLHFVNYCLLYTSPSPRD